MLSSNRADNQVKKIYERMHENRFDALVEVNNEVTFHVEINQTLMIKIYKYANDLLNSTTNKIFSKRNIEHNLRNYRELASVKN